MTLVLINGHYLRNRFTILLTLLIWKSNSPIIEVGESMSAQSIQTQKRNVLSQLNFWHLYKGRDRQVDTAEK